MVVHVDCSVPKAEGLAEQMLLVDLALDKTFWWHLKIRP